MAGQSPLILKENKVYKKTGIPRKDLEIFFATNLVEIKFKRRKSPEWLKKNREAGHASFHRRMLCTSNWRYISSPLVRNLYNWNRPKSRKGKAYYRKHNMLVTWDLLQNHWRIVSLDKYTIMGYTPITKLRQKAEFTEFYRQHLKNLPDGKKLSFNDK